MLALGFDAPLLGHFVAAEAPYVVPELQAGIVNTYYDAV